MVTRPSQFFLRLVLTALLVNVSVIAAPRKTLRSVPYKDSQYEWLSDFGEDVPSEWRWLDIRQLKDRVQLKKGWYRFSESTMDAEELSGYPSLRFENVVFGDLDGDGVDEAAVSLYYSTGGTAGWSYLYVFRLSEGRPSLIALLESGSRGSGGLREVKISKGHLIVEFADRDRMVGDCCSDGFIRETYRWTKKGFVRVRRLKGGSPVEEYPLKQSSTPTRPQSR